MSVTRYLAVGNLSSVNTWDIRFLFANPDVEFLHTGPGRDVFKKESRRFRAILADTRRGAYDLVFAGNNAFPYFNPRKGVVRNSSNLVWKVLTHPNLLKGGVFPYARLGSPLAGIDMEDRPVVDNRWFHILEHSVCFFKRELPQNPCNAFLYTTAKTECNGNVQHSEIFQRWIKKLRPISLGIEPDLCRRYADIDTGKKTDVFFAGDLHNRPNRQAGIRQLERLQAEGYAIDIAREKLSREEFLRRCAQARLVWSPEGFGWDCFRHYEIALVGSVPLMQSPTIQRYAPFMDEEHAIYYCVEADHLAVRVRQALHNRARLVEMGQAARQHVLKWHTHEALSRYVIEETKRTLAESRMSK
jgi:hypothetical protein